jgi:chromosome segregation ATPase
VPIIDAIWTGGLSAALVALGLWLRRAWADRRIRTKIVGSVAELLTDGEVTDDRNDPVSAGLDALQSAVANLVTTVDSQGEQLQRADDRISALEDKVAKRERRIAVLERDLAATKRALTEAHSENTALMGRVVELESELAQLKAQRDA